MYIVEGNIGSGKTTLLKLLQNEHNITISEEPVDEWMQLTDDNQRSVFELFYEDPCKYAFVFQMYILYTRMKQFNNISDSETLCERSIFTDKFFFMNTLKEQKVINDIEISVFDKWFDYFHTEVTRKIKGFIFLDIDPIVCFDRIKTRNRPFEKNISLDYIIQLHLFHKQFLTTNENVLIISDTSPESVNKIIKFIYSNNT
mgnify:CR=1 FL=1|tara:strand:+ start:824 stop:1426 length:603 start_codon:yes stop_codon:yes gene_type:complete